MKPRIDSEVVYCYGDRVPSISRAGMTQSRSANDTYALAGGPS